MESMEIISNPTTPWILARTDSREGKSDHEKSIESIDMYGIHRKPLISMENPWIRIPHLMTFQILNHITKKHAQK